MTLHVRRLLCVARLRPLFLAIQQRADADVIAAILAAAPDAAGVTGSNDLPAFFRDLSPLHVALIRGADSSVVKLIVEASTPDAIRAPCPAYDGDTPLVLSRCVGNLNSLS